jgi:hypothetical protein
LFVCDVLTIATHLRDVELLLGLLTKKGQVTESALVLKSMDTTAAGSLDTFLTTRLHYTKDANGQDICMVNTGEGDVGVMMGWERNISASCLICALIASNPGGSAAHSL